MSIGIAIGTFLGNTGLVSEASVGAIAPDAVSGLALWLKADALSLNDADPVSTWTASTGPNATGTTTTRPLFKTNIFATGKPALRWDGTDDIMSVSGLDLSAATAITVIMVTASISSAASQYMLLEFGENFNNNPAGQFGITRDSTFPVTISSKNGAAGAVADMTTSTSATEGILVKTTPRILAFTFDKSVRSEQAVAYVQGVWGGGHTQNLTGRTNNGDSGTGFAASQTLYIGARNASGVPTLFAPMDLGELLIYTRKLTTRELVRLHIGLDDKYDLFS